MRVLVIAAMFAFYSLAHAQCDDLVKVVDSAASGFQDLRGREIIEDFQWDATIYLPKASRCRVTYFEDEGKSKYECRWIFPSVESWKVGIEDIRGAVEGCNVGKIKRSGRVDFGGGFISTRSDASSFSVYVQVRDKTCC